MYRIIAMTRWSLHGVSGFITEPDTYENCIKTIDVWPLNMQLNYCIVEIKK